MITIGELFLSVLLALGIGGVIGTMHGWGQACDYAKELAKEHRTGERLVQVPNGYKIDQVTWGSGWLANKLCEGR